MATVELYKQNGNSDKTFQTKGLSLDQFKSQVIVLLQQLIKLCETEQKEALIFLKSKIDNTSCYIRNNKCAITECDSSFDSVNDDNLENDEIKHEIIEPLKGIEDCNRDEKETHILSSDVSKQSAEKLSSNDTSNNETEEIETDNTNCTLLPVKSSKKNVKAKEFLKCAICKKNFRTLPSFLHHLNEHDGTQMSCIYCKRGFNNYIVFNVHKSICQICRNIKRLKGVPFTFDRKNITKLQLSKVLCCPFCGENFSCGYNLRRHIDTEKCRNSDTKERDNVVQCKWCNKIFTSQEEHEKHIQNKHARMCVVCGPLIMSVRDWKRHKKTHEQEQREMKYNCKVCLQYFRTRQLLREHLRQHKSDLKLNKTIQNTDSRHRCKECSYASNCPSNLLRHTNLKHKTCTIDKKFSCHKCPRMFKLNNALREHLASVHSAERSHVCPMCPATFKLPSLLSRHVAGHNSASLSCACCHQRFHRHDGLKRHLRKHRATPEHRQRNTLQLLSPQDISVLAPQPLELATPQCSELIISTPARSDLMTSTPARSELVSLMDLQSGEMLTLSPADYMLYLSS